MKSIVLKLFAGLFIVALSISCRSSHVNKPSTLLDNAIEESAKKPKNIILLIGDGMGLSQVSASIYFQDKTSNFDRFSTIGLIKTSASSDLVTDSASGATAFASGIKTYNGAIGVDNDTIPVETIVEQLNKRNISTGLIATSSIVHATPASFFAHTKSRRLYDEIATFLPNSGVHFFAGGGLKFFNQRGDNLNLLAKLTDNGYVVNTTGLKNNTLVDTQMKQAFLLADNGMPKMLEGRGDFLPDATALALVSLSQNENGFFLMVEGSQIDWGGHDKDADYLISELLDFDKTIGVVLDFAAANGETLVIVTADHETGGFTLAADRGDYNVIKPLFSTDGHSATMVPVFAHGPGESYFGGIYENTEIYHKMNSLFSQD